MFLFRDSNYRIAKQRIINQRYSKLLSKALKLSRTTKDNMHVPEHLNFISFQHFRINAGLNDFFKRRLSFLFLFEARHYF
jgi:hypothetical protein